MIEAVAMVGAVFMISGAILILVRLGIKMSGEDHAR